jgi:hypothetical protein
MAKIDRRDFLKAAGAITCVAAAHTEALAAGEQLRDAA